VAARVNFADVLLHTYPFFTVKCAQL
jgi:hypothetical protein